jgi:hypothetical protein
MFCLYGRFVPPDVLSLRTFCPYGRFVSTDVLSLRTFCPTDVMSPGVLSPDVLSPDVLSIRTFCLRTFCLGTGHLFKLAFWRLTLIIPKRCHMACDWFYWLSSSSSSTSTSPICNVTLPRVRVSSSFLILVCFSGGLHLPLFG